MVRSSGWKGVSDVKQIKIGRSVHTNVGGENEGRM